MLYHPFIKLTNLLIINSQSYKSYIKTFQAYIDIHSYLLDFYINLINDNSDIDDKSNIKPSLKEKEYLLINFKIFTHCHLSQDLEQFINIDLEDHILDQQYN
jgi:hypothetical protein